MGCTVPRVETQAQNTSSPVPDERWDLWLDETPLFWTALHLAAARGRNELIDVLIEAGADLESAAQGFCDCKRHQCRYQIYLPAEFY